MTHLIVVVEMILAMVLLIAYRMRWWHIVLCILVGAAYGWLLVQ